MSDFKSYFLQLSKSEREALAVCLNTSTQQLANVAHGRKVSIEFALRLYQVTRERFDFLSLNTGLNWQLMQEILARSADAGSPQSAAAP